MESKISGINGKVVVITGGAGVLCSVMAKAVAKAGAKVALIGRHIDKVAKVAEEIIAEGGIAAGFEANVLDKDGLERARSQISEKLGKCDILINGAGGNTPDAMTEKEYYEKGDLEAGIKTFFDLDPEDNKYVLDLNFMGTILPTQVFTKDMLGKKGCSIVNLASMGSFSPLSKTAAYSGAKAAVSNLTGWLSYHFSHVGIRVNAIAPGFFVGEQNRRLLFDEDGTPTARTGRILAGTPMGRFGEPSELVGPLLFLISEDMAGFVNGVVIPVDGGFTAFNGI